MIFEGKIATLYVHPVTMTYRKNKMKILVHEE